MLWMKHASMIRSAACSRADVSAGVNDVKHQKLHSLGVRERVTGTDGAYALLTGVTGTASFARTCRRHCRHEYHTGMLTTRITGSHGARAMATRATAWPKPSSAPHESPKVLLAFMLNVAASAIWGPWSGVN